MTTETKKTPFNSRAILSWAIYDWANSAFATTVMAGFFPVFFKEYWSHGSTAGHSTYALGLANSGSSLVVALTAPFLGAVADTGLGKKAFLMGFTLLGCLSTAALFHVGLGEWQQAAWLYGVASFAFAGAVALYDAFIVDVSPPEKMDRVSSIGYGLGYLGGGILYVINVLMYLHPDWFGISSGTEAVKWSFVTVAAWWLIFSLPLALWVREIHQPRTRPPWLKLWTESWKSFLQSLRRIRSYRPLLTFLAAYLLYIDGVNTVIKMAVDYGMALGFATKDLIAALILVQFIAFPAAIATGWLAEKWDTRKSVFLCLGVYCLVTIFAFVMTESWHFYILAALIGLVQGGVQALSRSLFARMIPPEEAGEFFGFFNLLGKFSAVLGPVLVGAVSLISGEPRWSILVILAMLVSGGYLLTRVDPSYRVPHRN